MYKNSTTDLSLSKYSYSSGVYTRLQDFPISIPLQGLGAETATIAKDSTGKLWIAYESEIDSVPKITVIWSTSADHKTWDTTGKLLNTDAVDSDDIAAVVAFDNKIGVFWSNQSTESFVFRVHVDSEESEETWEDEEVVATGSEIADDHINFAVTDAQDLLVATKSSVSGNEINLFIRWQATGEWDGPYFISEDATRPIVLYDSTHRKVYVFYTDWSVSTSAGKTVYKKAPLSDLTALATGSSTVLFTGASEDYNNVTSTKDAVNATTGILIAAKEDVNDQARYTLVSIPPPVTHEETQTGGSTSSSTVTTGANLTAVSGHLYLAAIATKSYKTVNSVSGLGLTWTPVQTQCAGRNQTGVSVFQALGTPTGNGTVTATLASAPLNAVIAVSRYSGVDTGDPIGAVASHNTNGANGACSGGTDTNSYSFNLDLPTVTYGGKVYGTVAMRQRGHTPGANFTELTADVYQGSLDGDKAGLAVEQAAEEADPTTVAGTFTGTVDWAVMAIEILPAQ